MLENTDTGQAYICIKVTAKTMIRNKTLWPDHGYHEMSQKNVLNK